jgi:hypothetical protein
VNSLLRLIRPTLAALTLTILLAGALTLSVAQQSDAYGLGPLRSIAITV